MLLDSRDKRDRDPNLRQGTARAARPTGRRVGGLLMFAVGFGMFGQGCDLQRMAADGAAGITVAAAPKLEALWDVKLAMDGASSGIMQLEAMRQISPDNPDLLLQLSRAYIGYAFTRVELLMERAELDGNMQEADYQRARARRFYEHARGLLQHAVEVDDGGFAAAVAGDVEGLEGHLASNYPEVDDLSGLYWLGVAWGSLIGMAGDEPDLVADLPLAVALMEHVSRVKPAYGQGLALAFLGGYWCQLPAMVGGSIEKGSALFEKALELTDRRSHQVQLQYARRCALNAMDGDLYVSLLEEILEASDAGNDVRLANMVARKRAEFYLPGAHELF